MYCKDCKHYSPGQPFCKEFRDQARFISGEARHICLGFSPIRTAEFIDWDGLEDDLQAYAKGQEIFKTRKNYN